MLNLEELFRQTFDDRILSRQERRALAKILQEEALSKQELGVLRSRVFRLAEEELSGHDEQMVLNWLYQASKLLAANQKVTSSSKVYFSPGDECLHAIQHHLREAKSSIDICVFTISDNRITELIIEKHRQKIPIRIITDNDKMEDRGSDIYWLKREGLAIRIDATRHHMHHKFAVMDERIVLTGSYNWTRSAAEHNEENLLVSQEPSISSAYREKFEALWPTMQAF